MARSTLADLITLARQVAAPHCTQCGKPILYHELRFHRRGRPVLHQKHFKSEALALERLDRLQRASRNRTFVGGYHSPLHRVDRRRP